MTDSVLIFFILLMYFLYYSTFMIDIQYFNSLIVIFFTFIALVFTRKSTEAKKWSPHYSKLHRVNTFALFLVIFHQSLHSQAAQSFFRELLVMRYGVGQGIQDKTAFCSRIIRQLQIFNKKVDEESRVQITFNDPWAVSL